MGTRLSSAASLLLCLGLVTVAPAGAGAGAGTADQAAVATETTLSGSNPGVGALQLVAAVSGLAAPSSSTGVVVFEVDGREPVAVALGRSVIVGRAGDRPAPDSSTAVLGLTGLDPRGTYPATATFVPDEGSDAEGSGSTATTTLTRTVDQGRVAIRANGRGRAVELLFSVHAYPPGAVVGAVVVEDRALGVVITRRTRVRADRAAFWTVRGVSRGVHRYRATFVPAPRLRDTMTGSVATSRIVVGG